MPNQQTENKTLQPRELAPGEMLESAAPPDEQLKDAPLMVHVHCGGRAIWSHGFYEDGARGGMTSRSYAKSGVADRIRAALELALQQLAGER